MVAGGWQQKVAPEGGLLFPTGNRRRMSSRTAPFFLRKQTTSEGVKGFTAYSPLREASRSVKLLNWWRVIGCSPNPDNQVLRCPSL